MSELNLPRDYVRVRGVNFFARLLGKIRLHAQGKLPKDYNLGMTNSECFDARFCRFWDIDFDKLTARTLEGGTDEEVFDSVLAGRKLNPEHVLVWNDFLEKRGWRDEASEELQHEKDALGLGDRKDIQTFVDFHDADEGRKPKYS
jgi:gluconokinase